MTGSTLETTSLLKSAREGDDQAFASLVNLWRGRMLRIASRYTHCHAEAEDAVQSAFVKAWKCLPGFRGDSLFSTWLTRIVINEIHMIQRRPGYRRLEYRDDLRTMEEDLMQHGRSPGTADPETQLIRSERSARVRAAIKLLPHRLRAVLELELEDELPLSEAADRLDISISAVKSRRLRGRAELRRRLLSADPARKHVPLPRAFSR